MSIASCDGGGFDSCGGHMIRAEAVETRPRKPADPAWDEVCALAYDRFRVALFGEGVGLPWEKLPESERQAWREAVWVGTTECLARALTTGAGP